MAPTPSPLIQASSGALGAVVANALIYPLDTLTTRMQTASRSRSGRANPYGSLASALRTMLRDEGLGSFYRGLGSDSLSTALSNFIYFAVWSFLRASLIRRRVRLDPPAAKRKDQLIAALPVLSALEEIAIGILSGVSAKAVVSPLSNITVRQQTASASRQNVEGCTEAEWEDSDGEEGRYLNPSSLEIARDIYQEKGWTGFWSGFKSSIILTTNPAITSYLLEAFKRAVIPVKHLSHPTPVQVFLTSAFASSIASIITYPMILSKSRLMFKCPSGRRLFSSIFDVFAKTIRRHGVSGMYAGLTGQIVKGFLSEGIKMTVKTRLELFVILLSRILTRENRILST